MTIPVNYLMNEFYDIGPADKSVENEFQLVNLGEQVVWIVTGKVSFGGSWRTERNYDSTTTYRKTSPEDYDKAFVGKLIKTKPPYHCTKLLDYHLSAYMESHSDKNEFFKHVRYVVIPFLKKRKNTETFVEIVNDWLSNKDSSAMKNKSAFQLSVGNVSAPTQIQVNSDNSSQSQKIRYNNQQALEFFNLLKSDVESMEKEIKEEILIEIENATRQIKKDKNIESRLLTIGSLIRDVGINAFVNLTTSPVYEIMKPYLGL